QGTYERTIIIITSDHGEEFGEHKNFLHDEGHLYEEILHIPLIIANHTKGKSKNLVSLIDLAPTIAQLASIKIPRAFEGKSLFGETNNEYILGMGCKHRREYIETGYENVPKNIACRTYKYKLIYSEATGDYELYDLEKDPNEKINLFQDEKQSEIVRRMQNKVVEYRKKIECDRTLRSALKKLKTKL
ncbi:MAG TPA: DUF4976 domain-containing protein, partial [Candidatus Atribacteria bacterium]|nr:DUF4976 domain-containing protein [Candidatus Atribacteria bacterium]